jgi:hypothetical protein
LPNHGGLSGCPWLCCLWTIRRFRDIVLHGAEDRKVQYDQRLGGSGWIFRSEPLETHWILRHFDVLALVVLVLVYDLNKNQAYFVLQQTETLSILAGIPDSS